MLLRHPQPDIGAAGQQARIWMLLHQSSQFVGGCRREVAAIVCPHFHKLQGFLLPALPQRFDGPGRRLVELITRADLPHAPGRRNDRPIAGAAAQIARQRIVDPVAIKRLVFVEQGEQRHDEAGRAEAALRAVGFHHGLLHRMQAAVGDLEVLDGEELLAVERRHELDAGIDGAIADAIAIELTEDDRAGAAVAFRATLLGSHRIAALRAAEELQHRHGRWQTLEADQVRAAQHPDVVLRHCRARSTAPIGAVAVGREQQRHMVVLVRAGDAEADHHLVQEARLRQRSRHCRQSMARRETPVRRHRSAARRPRAAACRSGRRHWSSLAPAARAPAPTR